MSAVRRTPRPMVRSATAEEAPIIHSLIGSHLEEGHLLPRELGELTVHAERFVVVSEKTQIVACAELAPLSQSLAEVRSLVVDPERRGAGVGRHIVDELRARARRAGFEQLCAFTHEPAYFVRMGFSIVPHVWLPEKISTDCRRCPLFRRCGQYAMVIDLDAVPQPRAHAIAAHA